jgi:hypothetical protein
MGCSAAARGWEPDQAQEFMWLPSDPGQAGRCRRCHGPDVRAVGSREYDVRTSDMVGNMVWREGPGP